MSMWIIKHKTTGQQLSVPSGKNVWKKPAHAKNAWGTYRGYSYNQTRLLRLCMEMDVDPVFSHNYGGEDRYQFPKFDEQDTWELVEVSERVDSATQLLQQCLGRLTDFDLERKIKEFLEK